MRALHVRITNEAANPSIITFKIERISTDVHERMGEWAMLASWEGEVPSSAGKCQRRDPWITRRGSHSERAGQKQMQSNGRWTRYPGLSSRFFDLTDPNILACHETLPHIYPSRLGFHLHHEPSTLKPS